MLLIMMAKGLIMDVYFVKYRLYCFPTTVVELADIFSAAAVKGLSRQAPRKDLCARSGIGPVIRLPNKSVSHPLSRYMS
jgi:hypothetical protein